jgi:hypothetical protein
MSKILIHIIYVLIIAGASYISYRLGQRSARNAIKQLKLMKVELEKKSRSFPLAKLGSINPDDGRISLRIVNSAKEEIVLERVEVKTETFYVNPNIRRMAKEKEFKPFEFNKYLLLPERTISIQFTLDPMKHFDNVDFKIDFKDSYGNILWVKYRLNLADKSFQLIDSV